MAIHKHTWAIHLSNELEAMIQRLDEDIEALHESRQSDTKSSAGDKHETGRAMVDQELSQLNQQREKTLRMRADVMGLPERQLDTAQIGAVVETERLFYFISVSHGRLSVTSDKPVYALSPVSPAAQAMLGKSAGETFQINGMMHKITAVH